MTEQNSHSSDVQHSVPVELSTKEANTHYRELADATNTIVGKNAHIEQDAVALALQTGVIGALKNDLASTKEHLDSARIDELTGLRDRKAFVEDLQRTLERSEREKSTTAVVVLDAAFLKLHNDHSFRPDKAEDVAASDASHVSGDNYLRAAATSLAEHTRPGDSVYRLGGDEFAVILRQVHLPTDKSLDEFKAALVQQVEDPVNEVLLQDTQLDHRIPAHLSGGVAIYDPAVHASIESFVEDADRGSYAAKNAWKNTLPPEQQAYIASLEDPRFRTNAAATV